MKPVAWYRDEDGIRMYYDKQYFDDAKPLYSAQHEWVGLTDEEVLSEAKRFALGLSFPFNGITTPEMFARAIEAKLKEKNT